MKPPTKTDDPTYCLLTHKQRLVNSWKGTTPRTEG